ncbi:MAG: FadR/GntR family transcriptional regulator [Alphaproteobacteria bacterium]
MPFQAVESQRLYQRVAEQVAGLIESGELVAGARLPPERALAKKLGVSRPTVREAMIALEIAGLVEVRTGAGIYVKDKPAPAAFLVRWIRDAGIGPIELIVARRMIETDIAARAARHATKGQIHAILETIEMMEGAQSTVAHRQADRLFHSRVAQGSGNAVIVSIVEGLWSEMFSPMFERMGLLTGLFPVSNKWTLDDHRIIAQAIRAHDPAKVRTAMEAHLSHVEQVLLRGENGERIAGGETSEPAANVGE